MIKGIRLRGAAAALQTPGEAFTEGPSGGWRMGTNPKPGHTVGRGVRRGKTPSG